MKNNKFYIPKRVKTEIKIFRAIYFKDLITLFAVGLFLMLMSNLVHSIFKIPFFIFFMGLTIYMILPSFDNPKKRNYHSFIYAIFRTKATYHPLDINKIENQMNDQLEEEKQRREPYHDFT